MPESYPNSGEQSTPAPTPAYYAVIPADVRYHPDLPPNAKLLYGEITALCHKEGFCWATNQYFADLYKAHIVTVSKWIRALADAGFIQIDIDKAQGNVRHITLLTKTLRPISKKANTSKQKRLDPLSEKAKHNTTESITKKKTMNRKGSPAAVLEKSADERAVIQKGVALGRAAIEAARQGPAAGE